MSTEKVHHEDPEVVIESAIDKTEHFIESNSKILSIILIAVILTAGCYFGYKYLYAMPRQAKAADTMFVAEQLFAQENYQAALDGDGNNAGFLEVIDTYGCTPQANLARQYAGVCYLKLDKADDALVVLSKYKAGKGAPNALIAAQNYGLRADILSDKGQYKEALDLYNKAIKVAVNPLTTPYYLKKAGLVSEKLGDNAGAQALYKRITEEFGSSMEARDIDKNIGRTENN